jgi:hypothetical protein
MRPALDVLIDLIGEALSKYGPESPGLADVIIERATGHLSPRLVVQLTDGHSVSTAVRSVNFYGFCDRHSAWDLQSLRCALLREGRAIYADIAREHGTRTRLRDQHRRVSIEPRRDDPGAAAEARRHARRRAGNWFWQRWARRCDRGGEGDAQARGIELLRRNLTARQRLQYESRGFFEVVGGETGKRYRIHRRRQLNVEELDTTGERFQLLCFMPRGSPVLGDVMLAQKLALELFESAALEVANSSGRRCRAGRSG